MLQVWLCGEFSRRPVTHGESCSLCHQIHSKAHIHAHQEMPGTHFYFSLWLPRSFGLALTWWRFIDVESSRTGHVHSWCRCENVRSTHIQWRSMLCSLLNYFNLLSNPQSYLPVGLLFISFSLCKRILKDASTALSCGFLLMNCTHEANTYLPLLTVNHPCKAGSHLTSCVSQEGFCLWSGLSNLPPLCYHVLFQWCAFYNEVWLRGESMTHYKALWAH